MKKSTSILTLLILLFFNVVNAQQKNQLVNSGEVIKAAYQFCDSDWYNKAIDTLSTFDKGDTAYVLVLTELAYCHMKAQKYAEAIKIANKALSYSSPYKRRLIYIKGNSYDSWGYPDSAIAFYKQNLSKYPYSYLMYYNMGITYTNQKKYDEAVKAFQQAIIYNPFHTSSHIALGRLMARMGQYVHAMLCLETFLIIEPNTKRSNYNLVFLNNMATNTMDKEYEPIKPVIDNKAFEETDQLIKSGIALNANYKAKVKFDAPVAKQTQLLFESLQYKPNTGDFWMDHYVPMFLKAKDAGYMEDFMYTILTSAPDKNVANELKKRQKKIREMNGILGYMLSTLHKNLKIKVNGVEEKTDFHLDENNNMVSYGNFADDNKTRIGQWMFFHNNGEIKAEGNYSNGKLDGKWSNYDEEGKLSFIETYSNGELQGDYIGYYSSGNKKYGATYAHDHVQGDVNYYYDCDAKSAIVHFDNGHKNGKGTSFFKNGSLREEYSYVNDSLDGENKGYFPNGTLKWHYFYKDNKIQGKAIDYFKNGKPYHIEEYVNSIRNGQYTTFYKNGTIHSTGMYKNGKLAGEWKEFNENGRLTESSFYNEKGDLEGEDKNWDSDGKLYCIFRNDKGTLKEITYFDKNGKIISNTKLTGKAIPTKGYYADGNLLYEGTYKDGKSDGTWTYYFKSGKKSAIKNYKNGVLDGLYTGFFTSGIKEYEFSYTDGEYDGYYKKFFPNGNVHVEGWYVNGDQEGKWYYHQADGTMEKTIDFLNNKINGYLENYAPDRKVHFSTNYKNGNMISMTDFDTIGNQVTFTEFNGKNDYCLYYPDGKIRVKGEFKCNQLNSKLVFYDRNGKSEAEYGYLNDEKDGHYVCYNDPGKIKIEGSYDEGDKNGLWKYYRLDGTLDKTGYYVDNDKDSLWTGYYSSGKISYEIRYKEDKMIDTAKFYDSFGEFMYSVVFDEFGLVSYQYVGPDGKVSKNISPKDTGSFITYYKNGKVSSEHAYKYGAIQGKQKLYYSNGNPYTEYFIAEDNLLDGKSTGYYPNGKIKSVENYLLGSVHGTNQYFREDGTPERSEEYRYDDEHGRFIRYDQQGKKVKECKYWAGILLN